MRLTAVLALLAAGSAWACAPGGPPSPPGLSYDLPEDPTLTYAWGDTSRLEMSLSGQDFDASSAASAMVDATFTRIEGGLQASFTFDDFEGRFSQPLGSPSRASADDVTGPPFFDLDRRGKVSSLRPPQLAGSAAQVLEPFSLAQGTHLWDPGLGILVASRETPDLRGTLRASAAPAPLNLRVRQTIAIRLTDGG